MDNSKIARSSRYLVVVAVGLGLLGAACSDTSSGSDAAASVQPEAAIDSNESGSADNDSSDGASTAPDSVTEEDLARFIAATEAALVGTSSEGLILEAPEIYIAIAQASCARFTQGDTFEQVVNDHLDDTDTTPVTDDEHLIGALLGAAVETICPEHAAKL